MSRKIMRRQSGLHDYQIMHPTRDWYIGLAIAVSIFLVGAAASAQLYFMNKNISLDTNAEAEVVVYRESIVEAALERLRERDAVFSALQTAPGNQPVVPVATTTPAIPTEEVASTTPVTTTPVETLEIDNTVIPAPL